MTKIPYNGIKPRTPYEFSESADDDGWLRLKTIAEYLEDSEPIPPDLARWLGDAIKKTVEDRDLDKLLVLLKLREPRGAVRKYNDEMWLVWGKKVCDFEASGCKPEKALNMVLNQIYSSDSNSKITRTTLQEWRNQYREARKIHDEACL